jgi:hypothetical protein
MLKTIITWWVWTARPFIFNPIRTIRGWFCAEKLSEDDLKHLTPEERKALK